MAENKFIITIDGPCGAGKTVMARKLANTLSALYLDTGAIFRGIAYYAVHEMGLGPESVDAADKTAITGGAIEAGLTFCNNGRGAMQVFLKTKCISPDIRTELISDMASRLSVYPGIRAFALDVEKELTRRNNTVAEGRDIGSVVFPDAAVKFYLTAAPEERARRRFYQLPGAYPDLEAAAADMAVRDERDTTRETAPLVKPDGAFEIDSTWLTEDETEQLLFLLSKMKLGGN